MEFLSQLGITESNNGVSTGIEWIKSGGTPLSSFSPVDGKQIGSVTACDAAAYETVIKKAQEALRYGACGPRQSVGRS